jgi:hypothetical protein
VSLLDVVRSAVAVANSVTKPLQTSVGYYRYVSSDGEGKRTYSPDITLPGTPLDAVLEYKQKSVKTKSGDITQSRATLTLVDIAQLLAATNSLGISEDDLLLMPGQTVGGTALTPILSVGGFIDAGTLVPIATEAYIA